MKRKNYVLAGFIILAVLWLAVSITVNAKEDEQTEEIQRKIEENIKDGMDFSQIDDMLSQLLPDVRINFREILDTFLNGDVQEAADLLTKYVKQQVSYEFVQNKKQLLYMLFIAVVSAFFTVFCEALGSKQAADVSFYVMYAILMILCIQTFQTALQGMELHLEKILLFMKVFFPCYFISVGIAAGSMSAMVFYELVVVLIFLVEALILNVAMPVIRIYILIRVMDYLTAEEKLSEFADLLKTGIEWSMKALLGVIVGLNVVQGLLNPVIDSLKRNSLAKTVEALPGVGNVFGSVTELLLGTAVLIKNGIGAGGVLILLILCVAPVVQSVVLLLLYKLAAAAVQPVSDKRIVKCIRSVAEGYELMLKVLFTTMLLFFLTIAISAAATSQI